MSKCSSSADTVTLIKLPDEVQVHVLTYLRAFDLAPLQQTCIFYRNPSLTDKVVTYFVDHVYGADLTDGIVKTKTHTMTNPQPKGGGLRGKNSLKSPPVPPSETASNDNSKYTLEHLRSIELTVVARLLSLPEPKTGYYVSKSWVKKTLLWLEAVNEPTHNSNCSNPKKLTKKQQRQRNRRYVS
jgi:hypothetical protein